MSHQSLDPRMNRLDVFKMQNENITVNTNFITYEVFHQQKRGKQATHVGIVHAPNPELAMVFAKEQYGRRGQTTNLWVVKSSDIFCLNAEDEDMFETAPQKLHREAVEYKVRDRIEKYRKEHSL